MSELAEVLELMHTSIGRWRTLRAAGREWRHHTRAAEAWKRHVGPERLARAVTYIGPPDAEPEPEETGERWRLWLAKPDRTRAEFMAGEESITMVAVGDTWWSWSPSQEAMTNAGDPHHSHGTGPGHALIDPSPILPAVELEVVGRAPFLGRPTVELVARPSVPDEDDEEAPDWESATHGLGSGADAYRLVLDAERGILLRAEALLSDHPFRILEMEEVAFDEDVSEDTFTPPQAIEIEPVEPSRAVSLTELPEAVPFAVLFPEHPPFGPPDARIEPPSRRHGMPLQLYLDYHSPMAGEEGRHFWLIESADPLPEHPGVDWREEGGIRLGEDRRVRPPLRIAHLQRQGTHVAIHSHALGMDELRDLARSLVPLPPTPPAPT